MTRLGFVLDAQNCIGCHACTVACKSEHDVPLGVNRTWVKYIETGSFPNTSRGFTVMRCNQCDDAPCMTICPTSALFRADNGIVDFHDDNCIGCKSCMNACPYDALYINPETNTAHKCNFCNHRVEVGLEPSCAVVCPTEAIIVGDLDDPDSPISRIIARDPVAVRAPEQGTNPKVFYRGADQAALDPTRSAIASDGMIWADTTPSHSSLSAVQMVEDAHALAARTAYTTAHEMTWQSKVSGYLVTKAIAAGVMLIAALLTWTGALSRLADESDLADLERPANEAGASSPLIASRSAELGLGGAEAAVGVLPPLIAGLFLAITGYLLITDLKQPTRFHYLLTRGNRSSWLVKGAYVLMAFAVACAAWFVFSVLHWTGAVDSVTPLSWLAVPAAVGALGCAGYTAFLFGQCEGRDLWQTPLLLPTLLAQAVVAGGAAYGLLDVALDVPNGVLVRAVFLGGLSVLALLLAAEVMSHGTRHVELATAEMTKGAYASRFWTGIGLGVAAPAVLLVLALAGIASVAATALAGLATLIGLFAYEDAYVRAGQSVPLS